ncbi:uncharacterized protein LOC144767664 [Lissotriton helveticus]
MPFVTHFCPPYKADEQGSQAALGASTHTQRRWAALLPETVVCTMNDSRPLLSMRPRDSPTRSPSEERNNRSHHSSGFLNHPLMKVHNGASELQRRLPPQEPAPNKILVTQTVAREAPVYTNVIIPTLKNSSGTVNVPKRWKSERISKPKKAPVNSVPVRRYPLRLRRPPERLTF